MSDDTRKHLDYIEETISRMNQCSFKIKELMGVIVAAILAVFATTYSGYKGGRSELFIVAIIPTVIFWLIDAYYLYLEDLFRSLYKDVAGISNNYDVKLYDMSIEKYRKGFSGYMKSLFSITEWPIYVISIAMLVAGYLYF